MINEVMYGLGSKSSVIRELFSYGLERKKVVGADKVYDFSLGNPSIPAPHQKMPLQSCWKSRQKCCTDIPRHQVIQK